MTPRDDDATGNYASPPCYMHELDPAYFGLAEFADPQQSTDVMRWRKAERERLLKQWLATAQDVRRQRDKQIAASLEEAIGEIAGRTVSVYAPGCGEPDLLDLPERLAARGVRVAIPVVAGAGQALAFRRWVPGRPPSASGHSPAAPDTEILSPDVVIVPVLGFDRACHRLGSGDGLIDRTLASMPARPRTIGVAYSQAALPTIYPQPHDIPMDMIVTEDGPVRPCANPNAR